MTDLGVGSFDEWGMLREAIVGVADGACVPLPDPVVRACTSRRNHTLLDRFGGKPFPEALVEAANRELDGLDEVLRGEGIVVRRPDRLDHTARFRTPDFESQGLYAAMPRDVLSVLGDCIIEAPMGWRQRHFEGRAYNRLLRDYAAAGAGWLCGPKLRRTDALYRLDDSWSDPKKRSDDAARGRFVTTEAEPCFDAADMIRCGADVFIQRSQVTNLAGIRWIRRFLPTGFRLHRLSFDDPNPMHLDSTIMPLRPGLMMVNPTRPCRQRDVFLNAGWELVDAPPSTLPDDWPLFLSSPWLSMNLLVLDPKRVVVEEEEEPTIRLMRDLGFTVISLPFRHVYSMGGGLHCATCDIRRDGSGESYGFSAPPNAEENEG